MSCIAYDSSIALEPLHQRKGLGRQDIVLENKNPTAFAVTGFNLNPMSSAMIGKTPVAVQELRELMGSRHLLLAFTKPFAIYSRTFCHLFQNLLPPIQGPFASYSRTFCLLCRRQKVYCETQRLTDQKLSSPIFTCCCLFVPHR